MAAKLRVGIIGAGMAGLTVARSLSKMADVKIFEKSKGVGGRMATRRINDVSFDHGAQYFTVRDSDFRNEVDEACRIGVVKPWTGDMVSLSAGTLVQRVAASDTRYVAVPSMTALPKAMADGLDVRMESEVTEIVGSPGCWSIRVGEIIEGPFDWVVTAAPAPQSAAVLPPIFSHHEILQKVEMQACFTMMIRRNPRAPVSFAAARISDPIIGWIAYNQTKPGREAPVTLVVNSNGGWADANLDLPLDVVRAYMLVALQRNIPIDLMDVDHAAVHRWRFADVQTSAGQSFLLDPNARIAACGDWCIAGRVEAAYVSGLRLARAISELIREVG